MDPLMDVLLKSHLPSSDKRQETAQKMIAGYQNNWQPNPILTSVLEGMK